MLIKARQWIRETFVEGSKPTMRKVEQWVDLGEVPGRYINGELYIDDSFATHQPRELKTRMGTDLLA